MDSTPEIIKGNARHIKNLADGMILNDDRGYCEQVYECITDTVDDTTKRAVRRIRRLERTVLLLQAGRQKEGK